MKTKSARTMSTILGLLFALTLISASAQTTSAQWTSGTNINNTNGGNVGIGTTSHGVKLEVNGGFKAIGIVDMPSSSYFRGNAAAGYRFNNAADTLNLMRILDNGNVLIENGNVGIGKPNPTAPLDVIGDINLTGTIHAKYQDVAEWVESSEKLAAGTVVVLDSTRSNQVIASTTTYDTRVAGVISVQPGLALGEKGEGKLLVPRLAESKSKWTPVDRRFTSATFWSPATFPASP